MDEQALRALIREAVQRHLGGDKPPDSRSPASGLRRPPFAHPSHDRFNLLSGADIDGPCLIEPAVSCNHCGYCLSHGH